mmetsp:Transcript_47385/g.72412  ORF Transcript_47385/g.72412 Transcript_47385/m.72412 type:complete len:245 (-) Transcript_47385:152-886(-)
MPKRKKEKKTLTFYQLAFGLTPPYRVLVHPEVVKHCINQQINLREQLPKVLGDNAQPTTTKCIINHLRNYDATDHIGSAVLARKFNMVPCSHQKVKNLDADQAESNDPDLDYSVPDAKQILTPDACISDILEKERNQKFHNFVVATCITDKPRIGVNKFYKVPFLQLKTTPYVFTVEPPSERAIKVAKKNEKQSREVPEHELQILKQNSDQTSDRLTGKKRKRKKGVNPLSCKKSKKGTITASI